MTRLLVVLAAVGVGVGGGCAHGAPARRVSCDVYESAVRACRSLPERCPWSSSEGER